MVNKYTDFTFKFLSWSKLLNQLIKFSLDIRYRERNVVSACKTNYSSEKLKSDKISVYRFPKDETEKEKWIKAMPNANLRVKIKTKIK